MKTNKPENETDLQESKKVESKNSEIHPEPENKEGGTTPSGGGHVPKLDSIAANLSAQMPEVQEHALEQERITQNEELAQYSHLKDTTGAAFDPEIHKTNKNGEPTLSRLGKLIKKAGRKPQSQATKSRVGGQPVDDKKENARLQAHASGKMTANLLLTMGIALGGNEWKPIVNHDVGVDEKANLENAFADYFEATGKTDLPPSMALVVAVGAYALPRFTMPQTQTRLGKVKGVIVKWWVNRKLKKHGLKAEPRTLEA